MITTISITPATAVGTAITTTSCTGTGGNCVATGDCVTTGGSVKQWNKKCYVTVWKCSVKCMFIYLSASLSFYLFVYEIQTDSMQMTPCKPHLWSVRSSMTTVLTNQYYNYCTQVLSSHKWMPHKVRGSFYRIYLDLYWQRSWPLIIKDICKVKQWVLWISDCFVMSDHHTLQKKSICCFWPVLF